MIKHKSLLITALFLMLVKTSFTMERTQENFNNQDYAQNPHQQILILQFLQAVLKNNPGELTTLLESPECGTNFKVSCDIALDFAKFLNEKYKYKKHGLSYNVLIIRILKETLKSLSITPAENLDEDSEQPEFEPHAE